MNRFQPLSGPAPGESADSKLKGPAYCPPVPRHWEELDVSYSLLRDLILRHIRTHGISSFGSLSGTMKIASSIVQFLFEDLRQQQLVLGLHNHDPFQPIAPR